MAEIQARYVAQILRGGRSLPLNYATLARNDEVAGVDTPLTNGKGGPAVLRISNGFYLILSRIDRHLKVSLTRPLL